MQLDVANRDPFDSEREVQKLRKKIADHCVGHVGFNENSPSVGTCSSEPRNGYANRYLNGDINVESSEKERGDSERIEVLEKEVREEKGVRKMMASAIELRKRFGFATAGLMGKIYLIEK